MAGHKGLWSCFVKGLLVSAVAARPTRSPAKREAASPHALQRLLVRALADGRLLGREEPRPSSCRIFLITRDAGHFLMTLLTVSAFSLEKSVSSDHFPVYCMAHLFWGALNDF